MAEIVTQQHLKSTKIGWIEFAFTVFLIATYLVPPMHSIIPFFMLDAIFVVYLILCSRKNHYVYSEALKMIELVGFIALLYTLLTDTTSISGGVERFGIKRFFSKFDQYLLIFLPVFVFFRIKLFASEKQQNLLLLITLSLAVVTAVSLIDKVQGNDMLLRDFTAVEEGAISFSGWVFVYSYTFLAILFFLLIYHSRRGNKLVFLFFFLFSFYFLYRAQYTLSMVTTVITLTYIMKFSKTFGIKVVFFVVLFFTLFILPYIMDFLISITSSDFLKVRFGEIRDFFSFNSDEESDLVARLDLYWSSILAFLSSPIWGNRFLPFDGHATFLTCLADLGLLGGIPIWYLFIHSGKMIKKQIGGLGSFFTPFILQIFLMGLTNPIHSQYSNYILLWFFVPMMICKYLKYTPVNHGAIYPGLNA